MTAVVSREHAKATCLTGAAGMLMLAVAFVMMVVAAPGHGHGQRQFPLTPPAVQLTTDLGHQLTSRTDKGQDLIARIRAAGRGRRVEPLAVEPVGPLDVRGDQVVLRGTRT